MSRSQGGRIAVFIVTVPRDWVPQRPWHVPPRFFQGELFKKNLLASEAKNFANVFNKNAVQQRERGTWDHRWAIVTAYLKEKIHFGRRIPGGKEMAP